MYGSRVATPPPTRLDRGEGVFRLAYVQIDRKGGRERPERRRGKVVYRGGRGGGSHVNAVSAGFALCPIIKEPPPSLNIGVSLEILVRFTYFTVKGSTRGEVKEDRCLAEDARREWVSAIAAVAAPVDTGRS